MQRTRRQQFNTIDAPSLVRWLLIATFVAVTGLIYVYLTVQLKKLGDHKVALEKEITALRIANTDTSTQIANLTSRPALERRLKEGYLKLVPIPESAIARLSPMSERVRDDGVQPVANQRR